MDHIIWRFHNVNQTKRLTQHDGRVMNRIHFKTTTGLLLVTVREHALVQDGHILL